MIAGVVGLVIGLFLLAQIDRAAVGDERDVPTTVRCVDASRPG